MSLGRWLACGGLLATLTMAKGPQPVGFFALGVGGYIVARRRWTALPGLVLCLALPGGGDARVGGSRLPGRPGSLGLVHVPAGARPALQRAALRARAAPLRGRPADRPPAEHAPDPGGAPRLVARAARRRASPSPILPLAAYAGLCTLALLVWPGTKTRYAMPIAPAVAVMAGLAFGPLIQRRHWTAVAALAATVGLFVYQVVLVTVVIPHNVVKYSAPRRRAPILDAALAASPAPVFTHREGPGEQALLPDAPDRERRAGQPRPPGAGVGVRVEEAARAAPGAAAGSRRPRGHARDQRGGARARADRAARALCPLRRSRRRPGAVQAGSPPGGP